MCGLFLIHSFTRPINAAAFRRALARLKHRGPDDTGAFIADNVFFALGHQRLIINGGARAKQPFTSVDKNWYAAVNGEIYNPRDSLAARGMAFQTESDSEILLHLFLADGKAGLDALDGEFAFALWNQAENKSCLGRDPHGIKPLYYTFWQNQLIAASEIKALLEYGVPARWNLNYLLNAENFIQDAHETLVENIYALAPGHVLEFDIDGFRITPFVSRSPLEPGCHARLALPFDEAKDRFGTLLAQAVAKRLSRTQKNAVYLSGGIDSTVIAAIAAQHAPITAFTLGFEQEMLDESQAAQSLANALRIEHHLIRVGDKELADNFPAALYHAEMPVPNLNIAAKYFLSRQLQKAEFKVALTGEGADESLLGYGYFRQDLSAPYRNQNHNQHWPADWPKEWQPIQDRVGFIPAQIVRAAQHSQIYADLRSDKFKVGMKSASGPASLFQRLNAQVGGQDELIRVSQQVHYHSCFQTYNLAALADRTEMAHGIEGRPPFLDKFLVDFIHRLPVEYKFRAEADKQFIDKAILRAAAKAWLPADYAQAPKKAFLAPASGLRREGPLAELFQHYLLGAEIKIPIYDSRKIQAFYRMALTLAPQQQAMLDPVWVHLCSLCILQEKFALV